MTKHIIITIAQVRYTLRYTKSICIL